MSEPLNLAAGLLTGFFFGGLFFGGLWWTVHKGVASERAALWFLGSLVLRTAVVLIGFYVFSAGSWQRLLTALLGFVIARLVVMRVTRVAGSPSTFVQDTHHAP